MDNANNLKATIDSHVDGMLGLLITILEMGGPHVHGYARLLVVTHLIELKAVHQKRKEAEASSQPGQIRADHDGLGRCLKNFANELTRITHLLNGQLIPRLPELSRAVRQASVDIKRFRDALCDVQQLCHTQEDLYAWATSLVVSIDTIGEAFRTSSVYALIMWPGEMDLASVGVMRRSNFPSVTLGPVRKVPRRGPDIGGLGPSGGVNKF